MVAKLDIWAFNDTLRRVGALIGTPRQGRESCFKRPLTGVISANKARAHDGPAPQRQHFCAPASKTVGGFRLKGTKASEGVV